MFVFYYSINFQFTKHDNHDAFIFIFYISQFHTRKHFMRQMVNKHSQTNKQTNKKEFVNTQLKHIPPLVVPRITKYVQTNYAPSYHLPSITQLKLKEYIFDCCHDHLYHLNLHILQQYCSPRHYCH